MGLQPGGQLSPRSPSPRRSTTPTLDTFGRDLTELAREGKLDPVVGRDSETERCLQTLIRKSKNNPILIGEAGVGKTAIAEGLAQLIVKGEVPPELCDFRVVSLDVASMVAGTKYRGEFEERIKSLLAELQREKNIILFIDEIHTIMGAGGGQGAMDLSNILKPALARGELRCVGATTTDEYRKYIEKDPALERRFQPVMVAAPNAQQTEQICLAVCRKLSEHHHATYSPEVIKAAVQLAGQYIADRNFPDKAIDVLDEAGSRAQIAGEKVVTLDRVYQVASQICGVPVAKLSASEASRVLLMEQHLARRVIGQEDGLKAVARAVKVSRAGLKDPNRPIGSFLFLGPTGVGKTETAKAVAEFMFGREEDLITIDMSEFMEKHAAALLVGAPPGYVGYENGGILTERVRRKPYSVILLDEVEKAHPDVFNMLLQVLEEGRLTDGSGREVDFKNTIIIMTSNLGAQAGQTGGFGFGARQGADLAHQARELSMKSAVEGFFRPEFINRLDRMVVFRELTRDNLVRIVDLEVNKLRALTNQQGVHFDITPEAKELILEQGYHPEFGARPLKRALQNLLVDPLSEALIAGTIHPGDLVMVGREGSRLALRLVPIPKIESPGASISEAA